MGEGSDTLTASLRMALTELLQNLKDISKKRLTIPFRYTTLPTVRFHIVRKWTVENRREKWEKQLMVITI